MRVERFLDRCRTPNVLNFLSDQLRMRKMGRYKREPPPVVHARFTIDRDVVDVAQRKFALLQNVIDRARWQTGPMFNPSKTFLLRRGNQFAVDKQTRGGIAVICIQSQDFHPKTTEDRGPRTEDTGQNISAPVIIPW